MHKESANEVRTGISSVNADFDRLENPSPRGAIRVWNNWRIHLLETTWNIHRLGNTDTWRNSSEKSGRSETSKTGRARRSSGMPCGTCWMIICLCDRNHRRDDPEAVVVRGRRERERRQVPKPPQQVRPRPDRDDVTGSNLRNKLQNEHTAPLHKRDLKMKPHISVAF